MRDQGRRGHRASGQTTGRDRGRRRAAETPTANSPPAKSRSSAPRCRATSAPGRSSSTPSRGTPPARSRNPA
jgi:hypothetical protein